MVSSFSPPLFISLRSTSTSPALVHCFSLHGHFVVSSSFSISPWLHGVVFFYIATRPARSKASTSSPQLVGTEGLSLGMRFDRMRFALIFSPLFSSLPSRHEAHPSRYTPRQDLWWSHLLRSFFIPARHQRALGRQPPRQPWSSRPFSSMHDFFSSSARSVPRGLTSACTSVEAQLTSSLSSLALCHFLCGRSGQPLFFFA